MSIRRLKARGIGRLELLAWLNELLETDYTKVEHLADGIAYCQVLDVLHPGKVPLQQVQFHAKSHADCERNFRVLRRAFHACDIHKEIPVKKLVDGVFQEHFEFLHWLHDYAHKTYPDAVRKYRGFARRQQLLLADSTLSLRGLDHANMNLVPSYAMSSKVAGEGFLTTGRLGLALDIINPDEVPDNLTLDDIIGDQLTDTQLVDQATTEESAKIVTDPLLRYVEQSYSSTMLAESILSQLEHALSDEDISMRSRHKAASRQNKATKARDLQTSGSPVVSNDLYRLIEALSDELAGRAEDLNTLEVEINQTQEDVKAPPGSSPELIPLAPIGQ